MRFDGDEAPVASGKEVGQSLADLAGAGIGPDMRAAGAGMRLDVDVGDVRARRLIPIPGVRHSVRAGITGVVHGFDGRGVDGLKELPVSGRGLAGPAVTVFHEQHDAGVFGHLGQRAEPADHFVTPLRIR